MEAIEKELTAAAKLKSRKNEERQDFLVRLMKAVSRLDDAPWNELSSEAQDWTNEAAKSFNEDKAIAEFSPAPGEAEEEVPEEAEVEETSLAPEAPAEEVETKEEEVPEAEEEPESRPVRGRAGATRKSACHLIKTMVVKDPNITVKDIASKLKAKSLKVSDVTIASLRSSVRDTLRVMRELNMIDVKLR